MEAEAQTFYFLSFPFSLHYSIHMYMLYYTKDSYRAVRPRETGTRDSNFFFFFWMNKKYKTMKYINKNKAVSKLLLSMAS